MRTVVNSIAFYPALIACFFVALSYLMIQLDYSETGKQIKAQWEWLKLRDASTARSIISVIATGILSLSVFSFTMVMVVLNQAASQMSNKVLDKLIGNRFQQIVLGFYIGTIVYSLFLLSAIRDIDKGIYVPSLSTYLLIFFAITDIFLFIYFLHYITQSIKYNVLIRRIREETIEELKKSCLLSEEPSLPDPLQGEKLVSDKAGSFVGFNKEGLLQAVIKQDAVISFLHPVGTYMMTNSPLALLTVNKTTDLEQFQKDILVHIFIEDENNIAGNYYNGFRQLTEIAIKALSPGINDPGTAVESMRSIAELLSYRLSHHPFNSFKDSHGKLRIVTNDKMFEELVKETLLPIWDYGKNDRFIQNEMRYLLKIMLADRHSDGCVDLLKKVEIQILTS
jgi:uncharacterized membrane protein